MRPFRPLVLGALLVALAVVWWVRFGLPPGGPDLERIALPRGFHITRFADSIPGARSLALGAAGTVFVGTRSEDVVYALADRDGDGVAESTYVVARGLDTPNGVTVLDGALYVAEKGRLLRFDSIEARLADPPAPVVLNDRFPREGWHGWRYLRAGPDRFLYMAVGAPCNVCERSDDERFATILRITPAGDAVAIYARGVRNSLGFDWHPATGELWFTDNGRDWLGPDRPPDELNHAPRAGLHFGFPFCHGGDIPDPAFTRGACADAVPPAVRLGAHVAALGMRFYTGTMFPPEYRGRAFIAEHGSWNRVIPVGYRIMTVREDGGVLRYEIFAQGWLSRARRAAWGRPVDLLVMPDGALLVSDDEAGVVYRIAYREGA
jgi:glucose/arabinose dehydrogenase